MAGRNIALRTSPRPRLISKLLSQCPSPSLSLLVPTKRYSDRHGSTEIEAERASSTAEEFERIAEEKLKETEHESLNQTADGEVRETGDAGSAEKTQEEVVRPKGD